MGSRPASGPWRASSTTSTLNSGLTSTVRRRRNTGLIGAAARMRPSRSVQDMEVSSLKKKFKDKKFAAGCSRDVIRQGAERLGWELDVLMERTIQAMRSCEERVNREMEAMA